MLLRTVITRQLLRFKNRCPLYCLAKRGKCPRPLLRVPRKDSDVMMVGIGSVTLFARELFEDAQ